MLILNGEELNKIPSGHMTLIQRRFNVDATSWRCIDVEPALYKRHVPAGLYACFRLSDFIGYNV